MFRLYEVEMRLPNDTQRITIIGATGSGKTVAGLWQLSLRNYDVKPWIIYDYKYEELIASIDGAQTLSLESPLPTRPGVYIVHPNPDDETEVENHMLRIWAQEDIGVFVDEGYMIGNRNKGFRRLLTQGRSKHVPMIILTQRPVWMDRFVFTESNFFQVFRLQDQDDLRAIQRFIPYDLSRRLPEYHSYYYDVSANKVTHLSNTPDPAAILDTFDTKLQPLKKVI